jgi:hypothetical protein
MMRWFHRHRWKLVGIFNDQGFEHQTGYNHSHWVYECECGAHKQRIFDGHFNMPDSQKQKEIEELNRIMEKP